MVVIPLFLKKGYRVFLRKTCIGWNSITLLLRHKILFGIRLIPIYSISTGFFQPKRRCHRISIRLSWLFGWWIRCCSLTGRSLLQSGWLLRLNYLCPTQPMDNIIPGFAVPIRQYLHFGLFLCIRMAEKENVTSPSLTGRANSNIYWISNTPWKLLFSMQKRDFFMLRTMKTVSGSMLSGNFFNHIGNYIFAHYN